MQIKPLTEDVSVGSQVRPGDIAGLAARGIRTIVCNRPDGEEWGQPTFAEIAQAASEAGIEAVQIPIYGGNLPPEAVAEFRKALDEKPGPVLAYCRSGMRSSALWALSQARTRTVVDILASTARAGYDLSGLAPRLSNPG